MKGRVLAERTGKLQLVYSYRSGYSKECKDIAFQQKTELKLGYPALRCNFVV